MANITVNIPAIGTTAFFTFKDPFNKTIKSRFNTHKEKFKLKVISIVSMEDMIRSMKRDPYSEVYALASISEVDYAQDKKDQVPIITFAYTDNEAYDHFFRVPLNYIDSFESPSNVEYVNRALVLNLGKLPMELNLTSIYEDVADFVTSRLGVKPVLKDISTGEIDLIDMEEHEDRETIRVNNVIVHKTLSVQLEEMRLDFSEYVKRVGELGIILGEEDEDD